MPEGDVEGTDVGRVSTREDDLTPQQRFFMESLEAAILLAGSPVSVDQIRDQFKKSDSRVRVNIRVLTVKGYVHCVKRTRVKRYVPTSKWSNGDQSHPWSNGKCQTDGCTSRAEDFWRDGYYCRACIIGCDSLADSLELRERFLTNCSSPSSAGQWVNYKWPTYDEDVNGNGRKKPRGSIRVKRKKNIKH